MDRRMDVACYRVVLIGIENHHKNLTKGAIKMFMLFLKLS